MAITSEPTNTHSTQRTRTVRWTGLTNGNTTKGYDLDGFTDVTLIVSGTFDGATAKIYTSDNLSDLSVEPGAGTWVQADNAQGTAAQVATSADSVTILDNARFICVQATGGGANTNLTIDMKINRRAS